MGSLNALNARPHDDGFPNPCRRTSKVFCKTHLGLREQAARRRRVVESRLGIQIRNMKMVLNIYGTWRQVTFEKLMMKIHEIFFYSAKSFSHPV